MFSLTNLLLLAWIGGTSFVLMDSVKKFKKNDPTNLLVVGSLVLFVMAIGIFFSLIIGA